MPTPSERWPGPAQAQQCATAAEASAAVATALLCAAQQASKTERAGLIVEQQSQPPLQQLGGLVQLVDLRDMSLYGQGQHCCCCPDIHVSQHGTSASCFSCNIWRIASPTCRTLCTDLFPCSPLCRGNPERITYISQPTSLITLGCMCE